MVEVNTIKRVKKHQEVDMYGVKPRLAVFCCLAFLGIIVGSCAKDRTIGPRGSWHVSGRVTDSVTGQPIDSAYMIPGDTSDFDGTGVYSNGDGFYNIELPILIRDVTARKEGYLPQMRGFHDLQPDNTVSDLDFRLKPK